MPSPWNVPFSHNDNYVYVKVKDEKTELSQLEMLHNLLSEGKEAGISQVNKHGISGMGGVGKTQLAVEYAHKYKNEYPAGVLWVRSEKEVLENYGLLADELHLELPNQLELEKRCHAVRRTLQSWQGSGLLILDNLDSDYDYKKIKPYLPTTTTGRCKILITSRINGLVPGREIELGLMTEKEALELLSKESTRSIEEEGGKTICLVLGYLPIAVELAGKYLADFSKRTFEEYLERLKKTGIINHRFQEREEPLENTDHIASLRATLSVNDELLSNNQLSMLLAALCCFAPGCKSRPLVKTVKIALGA